MVAVAICLVSASASLFQIESGVPGPCGPYFWSTSSRVSRAVRTSTPGDRWEVLTFCPAGWLARVDLVRRTTWGVGGSDSDIQ